MKNFLNGVLLNPFPRCEKGSAIFVSDVWTLSNQVAQGLRFAVYEIVGAAAIILEISGEEGGIPSGSRAANLCSGAHNLQMRARLAGFDCKKLFRQNKV
jgi:hypothetical protein